ncbi:MAG: CPBP family intramembrane metalloprotease [Clostridiales bacterium]|nr:CPBP family intramembrane metalloprotease [Clostridiales bacterium]
MTKLYKKSEITFAILWIIAYVILSSIADQLSESVGIKKSLTAALHAAMSLILFLWIRKNGLSVKYGLCKSGVPAKRFLYYLPLAVIASTALWSGIGLPYGPAGTVCYVISMCCVGFLEEVIFRGLLFRAMEKGGLKTAAVISALTFGFGHIVNLFNESGRSFASSVFQIAFAVLVGFVLVLIFIHSGSLIPCILFHSANNVLHAFEAESSPETGWFMALNAVLVFAVLGGYLLYLVRTFGKKV